MIPEGHKKNLETIIRAAKNGDLCLMECTTQDGTPVCVLCAHYEEKGEHVMTPLAQLFDSDPYEDLTPPEPGVAVERQETM